MELLAVQKAALNASSEMPGFAFFMEMGLGKTLTALTEFGSLVHQRKVTRLVVICPNSFKTGWQEEIAKHGFDFDVCVFNSGADYWNHKFVTKDFDKPPVLIINYEAVRSGDTRVLLMKFIELHPSMLVIDESIQIKTWDSDQTKATLSIAPYFPVVRVLSGKPVTEGPHDLWAQMRAIRAIKDNYFPFKVTFCKMGGFKGKKVVGTQNEDLLASKIDKYVFRASKADWTDLPPKMYTSREYKLTPRLAKQYKDMENDFVLWLNETEYVAVDAFITKYIKLLQVQSGFIIQEDGSVKELVKLTDNHRFMLVRELVDQISGKVVIPYIHKYTRGILERILAHSNPAVLMGGMQPEEIQAQKNKFNNQSDCRVILAQTRASKYGHTLIGGSGLDRCSTMIFAENSYSLDDRSQIEDRIHRHGQTADSCLYIDLWGTDLDRKVTKALQAKENIAQAVFQHFGLSSSSNSPALHDSDTQVLDQSS